jgi:general secretion pathway protein I
MTSDNPNKLSGSRSAWHGYTVGKACIKQCGFTLIEVVVALAIVVVSFMALYGGILQMVSSTILMQEKTIASWVAFDQITELRIKATPPSDSKSTGIVEMGGISWLYSVEIRPTESESISQVIVSVAPEDEPDRTLGLVSGVIMGAAPSQVPGGAPTTPSPNQPPIVSGASPVRGATQ